MPTSAKKGKKRAAHVVEADVLERTNKLISVVGLSAKPIAEISELQQCAASMFVAIFESMFRVRVRDIIRVPTYPEDYKRNAQLIIKALTSAFRVEIPAVTGNLICEGDVKAISDVVDVISDIIRGKIPKRRNRSRSASLTRSKNGKSPARGSKKAGAKLSVPKATAGKAKKKTLVKKKKRAASSAKRGSANSGTTAAARKVRKKPGVPKATVGKKATTKGKRLKKKAPAKRPKSARRAAKKAGAPRKQAWASRVKKRGIPARPPRPSTAPAAGGKRKAKKKAGGNPADSADILINEAGAAAAVSNGETAEFEEIDGRSSEAGPETNEGSDDAAADERDEDKYGAKYDDEEGRTAEEIEALISQVDGEKAGQPLWDLLWKTRATASTKASMSPRKAVRQERVKRHRMYKKLLKEQLRAAERSSELGAQSNAAHSKAEAHKRRVEMIQQQRLKQDLRRAALARMARRRRNEERTVDKLFQAALRVERKRLAEQRAETKRAAKVAEIEKKMKLDSIEKTYAERRRMITEQVKQEEKDRRIAKYAQKMEVEKMARELRKAEKKRIQDLVSQLETQDANDAGSDWTGLDALQLEGPQAAGKLREMLVKYLGGSVKDDWAKNAAKRAARLAQDTAPPSLMESP